MSGRQCFDDGLGPALLRWRRLHRVKQAHAAEMFGVTQSTISRWEAGLQAVTGPARVRIEALVAARLACAADRALGALVRESPRALHLVCDRTHRLLACSKRRERSFALTAEALLGRSLLRYASEAVLTQESRLRDLGWFEAPAPQPVTFETGANRSRVVRIRPSRCRWTRILLSDGTAARLVETIDGPERSSAA